MKLKKKYKSARLCDCKKDLEKRWYVEFSILDQGTGEMTRIRNYSINTIEEKGEKRQTTEKERRALAKKLIAEYNQMLEEGYSYNSKNKISEEKPILTIVDALYHCLKQNKNLLAENTSTLYTSIIRRFEDYQTHTNKVYKLADFDLELCQNYCDWRKNKCGKTTYSNFINLNRSLFNQMIRREFITKNHFLEMFKPAYEVSRNVPFTDSQRKILIDYFKENHPSLYLLCITIFYTFARPDELRNMKIDWIIWERSLIKIPAKFAKGRKKGRYVRIAKPLMNIFRELKINDLSPNFYIFAMHGSGDTIAQKIYFSNLHRSFMKKLGYKNTKQTLYSWKHTGVIAAYRAGVDIKTIQAQCGHSSLQITDMYLRDLGLYQESEAMDAMPEF